RLRSVRVVRVPVIPSDEPSKGILSMELLRVAMEVTNGYKLQPGERAPNFALPGVDGGREGSFELASFAGSKALVVAFWCNHCPYVHSYEPRVVAWADEARKRGVGFVAINSNDETSYPEDAYPHMVARAREKKYNFPY